MALDYPTRYDPNRSKPPVSNGYLTYYPEHNVFHPGIDFNWGYGNQDKGQDVITPTWGFVIYVSPKGTNGGLGNYLVLYHPHNSAWTRYLHLERIDVEIGQTVAPKQRIGALGDTGTVSAHLHFEVLNAKGFDWITNGVHRYGRYPSGLSRAEVASMWIDPNLWLQTESHYVGPNIQQELNVAQKALKWAVGLRRNMLLRKIDRLTKLV